MQIYKNDKFPIFYFVAILYLNSRATRVKSQVQLILLIHQPVVHSNNSIALLNGLGKQTGISKVYEYMSTKQR